MARINHCWNYWYGRDGQVVAYWGDCDHLAIAVAFGLAGVWCLMASISLPIALTILFELWVDRDG